MDGRRTRAARHAYLGKDPAGKERAAAEIASDTSELLRRFAAQLSVVAAASDAFGDGAGHLLMQAQGAAMSLARQLGQPLDPGHLLTALLDQGTPDVLRALTLAGLDPAAVRRAALAAVGAPADLPLAGMPPLAPAGSMDRPALPVAELDERAWGALRWRQDHLPLGKLRRHQDWAALGNLERAAAMRIAGDLGLDDDQRFSLISHHDTEVARRAAAARPDLAPRPRKPPAWARHPWRFGFPAGWEAWLSNRWVSVRDHWFRLRTRSSYRQAPQS